jgi:hypothetical protein
VVSGTVEHMFDTAVSALGAAGVVTPERAADLPPDQLADVIACGQRLESVLMARKLAAVAALLNARSAAEQDNPERQYDIVDGYEQTSAEVSALLNISATSASYIVHYASTLAERLPRVGALLAAGQTDWRTVYLIITRTDLVSAEQIDAVDERLAARIGRWHSWSRQRIINAVDAEVLTVDADAAKQRRRAAEDQRFIEVSAQSDGMAEVYGRVSSADGSAFDRKLSQLAGDVCPADPRTMQQRRADALAALTAGNRLTCKCGQPSCPAAAQSKEPAGSGVLLNVIAGEDTISGATDRPGYLEGYGVIDADQVRELAAAASRQRIIDLEASAAEALRYQPSERLARAIRARDLTCRFPGCSRPATHCDIDHTRPFNHENPAAGGLTVPSNLKCLCRKHHRLKTFGPGWRDEQSADGTVVWTSPTGKQFETKPAGAELFPEMSARRSRPRAREQEQRVARQRHFNRVQRPINEAEQALLRARKDEIEARKFRNHMRDMLFLFKGKPSTSPFCTWVNDPYEAEELPQDWEPPPPSPPLPDDPPF